MTEEERRRAYAAGFITQARSDPWELGEQVIAPCRYSFPRLDLLRAAGGRSFLKLIDRALGDYERLEI